MAAKAALVTQRRDPHHHRVAILVVAEELQTRRFATNLVRGVMEVRQVLDLGQRQHAHVGVTLGQAKDHGLVEQRRSEEHTSELQSLMRISYAAFCLKNKN